jgi:hypothetical protein
MSFARQYPSNRLIIQGFNQTATDGRCLRAERKNHSSQKFHKVFSIPSRAAHAHYSCIALHISLYLLSHCSSSLTLARRHSCGFLGCISTRSVVSARTILLRSTVLHQLSGAVRWLLLYTNTSNYLTLNYSILDRRRIEI